MCGEKWRSTLALGVARDMTTRTVFITVVPRKPTGKLLCRRLVVWHPVIGVDLVEIVVMPDDEIALASLIGS